MSAATAKRCVGSGTASAAADTRAGARIAYPACKSFMAFVLPCGQPKLELQQVLGPKYCCYTVDAAERGGGMGSVRRAALKIGWQTAAE